MSLVMALVDRVGVAAVSLVWGARRGGRGIVGVKALYARGIQLRN